jgi:hypothetical protein
MKLVNASALGLLLLGTTLSNATAGPNANAKVVIHLASLTSVGACTRAAARPACADVVTSAALTAVNEGPYYFAYVLVADSDPVEGLAGFNFGIYYNSGQTDGVGLDVFGWTLCATLELAHSSPVWPSHGSSNLVTWDSTNRCQRSEPGGPGTGVVATAGYFYCAAYSPATLSIGPYLRPTSTGFNKVTVATCEAEEDIIYNAAAPPDPSPLGSVRFSENGKEPGYNPCAVAVPVQPTTWSGIKSFD